MMLHLALSYRSSRDAECVAEMSVEKMVENKAGKEVSKRNRIAEI
jgi:hypothetical protein